jgi:hypothetical protein
VQGNHKKLKKANPKNRKKRECLRKENIRICLDRMFPKNEEEILSQETPLWEILGQQECVGRYNFRIIFMDRRTYIRL